MKRITTVAYSSLQASLLALLLAGQAFAATLRRKIPPA